MRIDPCDNVAVPSTCVIWGDPHYTTFDGKPFDYQGVCKHVLATPCESDPALQFFKVLSVNENRDGVTSVSYTRYVEVVYKGTTLRLVKHESAQNGAIQVYALVSRIRRIRGHLSWRMVWPA
jgi:von Willebrand factor type D domain